MLACLDQKIFCIVHPKICPTNKEIKTQEKTANNDNKEPHSYIILMAFQYVCARTFTTFQSLIGKQ